MSMRDLSTEEIRAAFNGDDYPSTSYEGRCEHCGRDIGDGHEPDCPYYRPRRLAAGSLTR